MPLRSSLVKNTALVLLLAAPPARAAEEPSFRFAVMDRAHMDMGVCDTNDYELAAIKIKEQSPDFVVFLGGMADVPRAKGPESAARSSDAVAALPGLPVHNVTAECGLSLLPASAGAAGLAGDASQARHRNGFYSFEHRNNLFILLDSGKEGAPGDKNDRGLFGEQAEFLKSAFGRAGKYDNAFVFKNRSVREDPDGSPWSGLLHPLLIGKARHVFTASAHYFCLETRDGVNYVNSGFPLRRREGAECRSFSHFLLVTVAGGKVSVDIVPLGAAAAGSREDARKKDALSKPEMLNAEERRSILSPAAVVSSLNIKPGMKILDVGAGTGFFTFPFAEALGGTGRVFAADMDPEMIALLGRTIREKGYKNVVPVRVAAEGVDPFYSSSVFDIIFLSEVYQCLLRPADYFRGLRRSLAGETGRLYIIHFRPVPDFDEIEFDGLTRILERMRSFGEGTPFFRKAAAGIEDFVGNRREGPVPSAVRKRLIGNFNRLLSDRAFFNEILEVYSEKKGDLREKALLKALRPDDLQLARWLMTELNERGVFAEGEKRLTEDEAGYLRALNRILLAGIFEMNKLNVLKGDYALYAGKKRIISDMEAAGYKFVRELETFTYYYFLEFKNGGG